MSLRFGMLSPGKTFLKRPTLTLRPTRTPPLRVFALCCLSLGLWLWPVQVAAQKADPKPPVETVSGSAHQAGAESSAGSAAVTPPKLAEDPNLPYPEGASGDGEVVLVLTVDSEGKVRSVEVESGLEPFRSVAGEGGKLFRFTPALRDREPVAATIRFLVSFKDPEQLNNAEPLGSVAPESPKPAAPREELVVDVIGKALEPTVRSFSRAEVRELPGAFGDPFRAVEALPGVTAIFSGVPFFYVRGAPPGNVGYFLDGIQVPLLYHAGLGPSVIHPGLVDTVNLYPGAYPARYGRFAGGIVAGETSEPALERRIEGNIRLFDSGLLVETPLDGGKVDILLAGRYSYAAALISLFADNVRLEYWDYQARLSRQLSSESRLTIFSFGAFDYFGEAQGDNPDYFGAEFHRVDLRLDDVSKDGRRFRNAVTVGIDRTRGDGGEASVVNQKLGFRSEYDCPVGQASWLRSGADATLDRYSVELPASENEEGDTDFEVSFPSRSDLAFGVRGDLVLPVDRQVTITPGVRLDGYYSQRAFALALEPRVMARYQITRDFSLIPALALAHQPPSFVIPLPGFQLGGLEQGLQRSVQNSFGSEFALFQGVTTNVTLFHNLFFNMTDALSLVRADEELDVEVDTRTQGQAYGLELLVKRDLSRRLGGFLSYTLSRSVRYTNLGKVPSSFDRTHTLHGALGYDLGRTWRAGSRFSFYTGSPGSRQFTLLKPTRLPPYYRLDVRLEKRWQLGRPGAFLSFVFEVLNTTLNEEPVNQDCDPRGGCTTEYIGPVTIPSIGLEGAL